MTSSLRVVALDETLARARRVAAGLGVTRVTDTTWLDYLGIPVFASIRPSAGVGSLCVNAGKGVRVREAQVGAYMEAIEYALAEYGPQSPSVFESTPREVAGQGFDFVDLCPLLGRPVDPDGPLMCVMAEDIADGTRVALPAELVFAPYRENQGQRVFGSSTTGLASGNSVAEATVHGLAEVIERDVSAFNHFGDRSRLVEPDTVPPEVAEVVAKVEDAGLRAVLRYTPTEFGLPYFRASILEPDDDQPIAIAQGAGLHLLRDIAAVRGLCEAAQSRLTGIHGGRDDLMDRVDYFAEPGGADRERRATRELRAQVTDTTGSVRYSEIPAGTPVDSIGSALHELRKALSRAGIEHAYRVTLSTPDLPLAVVRVIVPGMESFEPGLKRVGPRLAARVRTA
ncbi:YcaO-like family protein [Actinokineospora cianjurensis]|uniref:Ribosomal protein S12 methylthiotransferase accessory factor n=1 Tax=Actinokineospora cianjurensis TaxID=585224 RepID=A0A421AXF8_9PSEU|nr:YcaO-like family protein [Actinokineospora cianjurensis]RLK54479.1 ribosomal protein S12 methylthiotransferase accessory factor [Actinokineospora cianjurensis]